MARQKKHVAFRCGPAASVIPIAVFISTTVLLVLNGGMDTLGMIVAAMLGISVGMLFCTNPDKYMEAIFSYMSNRVACITVVCWLWAGAFSGILADSGLIESIVWVGLKINMDGRLFVLCTFLFSALFALSTGSAFVTVVGFMTVIYPAGILFGSPPGPLAGAIMSGAAFGDNLAPVSDTTIVSAATQETDIGGVVVSRLKYSLTAGAITAILFFIFGGGLPAIDTARADKLLSGIAAPEALPMILPPLLVIVLALRRYHIIAVLSLGILSALVIGPLIGTLPFDEILYITADGSVAGSVADGVTAMLPISVLILLIIAANGLMEAGGFYDQLLSRTGRLISGSTRRVESAIIILISFACLCLPGNTSSMVTVGPFANRIRKQHGVHPYRSANLLDTIACSFPYMLPYAAVIIAAVAVQNELSARYDFVVSLNWLEIAPFVFYGIVLFPLMIISVLTGFGRKSG